MDWRTALDVADATGDCIWRIYYRYWRVTILTIAKGVPSLPFDESGSFTPPPAFGPFRVLHQIGSGVLGPVFRTYDPQADTLVAVKVFRLDLVPEDVVRLADALRRLVGKHGTLAAGLENTSAYLATEYLGGESLDVALRHLAPAPLDTALPILETAARLIDSAWAGGPEFGHGALHPRDVIVTAGTLDVAITGFGVVPALDALQAGRTSGAKSPIRRPYTAPERVAGEPWDIRADVYSLAAITHELLTGRRPAGPSEQDGALPASMPAEQRAHVRRVLSKALAESPAQRFASAGAFVAALSDPNALPEPIVASAAPTPVPPPRVADDLGAFTLPIADAGTTATPAAPAFDEFDLSHVVEPAPTPTLPPVVNRRAKSRTVAMPVVKPADLDLPPIAVEPVPVAAPRAFDAVRDDVDDEPRFRAVEPDFPRAPESRFTLPPPIPWAAFAAILVAGLVIGAAIDHQWMLSRGVPAPPAASPAGAGDAGAAVAGEPAATGQDPRTDTEVSVGDAPAATSATPSPPAAVASNGRIAVRSTPSGAMVTIDGKLAGRTPLTASGLTLGGHAVVIARPGYASDTRNVTLSSRTPTATLNVTLKAARPPVVATTGSVSIDTRPRGARITIDGRAVGQSPLSVPGLSAGRHALRLELTGYTPVVSSFDVKPGETARVAVTLEIR